jgi:putative peptidoglycan lipid II flippase
VGLVPFSLFQLFLRAFYSLQDTRTPFLINCGCVALNIAVNVPAFSMFGVEGLAAGHAISYVVGAWLQARFLAGRIGGLGLKGLAGPIARIAVAAAGMGVLVWLALQGMEALAPEDRLFRVLAPVSVGVVGYLGLTWALGVRELDFIRRALARRGLDRPNSQD